MVFCMCVFFLRIRGNHEIYAPQGLQEVRAIPEIVKLSSMLYALSFGPRK